jgi:hypothetical protein
MLINEKPDWQKEFERVSGKAVYFMEKYYNGINSDNRIELQDDEKQRIFNKYKKIPLFNDFNDMDEYEEKLKSLREKGYKDWEIF